MEDLQLGRAADFIACNVECSFQTDPHIFEAVKDVVKAYVQGRVASDEIRFEASPGDEANSIRLKAFDAKTGEPMESLNLRH